MLSVISSLMSLVTDIQTNVSLSADWSGQYIAIYSPHTNIKVWSTSNGKKAIEHSVKLKAGSYSAVSWSPQDLCIRKSCLSIVSENSDEMRHKIFAYGTARGCVGLMYALVDKELFSNISVHSTCVRDLIWNQNCCRLYSSADDKCVVEWSLSEDGLTPGRVIKIWKKTVGKLALSVDTSILVAASCHIRLWDMQSEEVVQRLSGHTSQVNCLEILHSSNGSLSHVVSVGRDERMITVHRVQLEGILPSTYTLRCPHHPVSIHKSKTNNIFIVASNGNVYMYKPPFESESCKPIAHVWSLQITDVSQSNYTENPKQIPILSLHCCEEEGYLLLVYGNALRPVFEKIQIDLSEKRVNLERFSKSKSSLSDKSANSVRSTSNTAVPIQLVPAHRSKKLKRKRPIESDTSLDLDTSIGDLLAEQEGNSKSEDTAPTAPIASGSLMHMLCQSLQSEDSSLFNQVVSVATDRTINVTVKSLPLTYVLPFIDKTMSIMHVTAHRAPNLLRWIKPCLSFHTAYLLTVPDLVERLGMLYELLDARTASNERLSQLQGKLELMANPNKKQAASEEHNPIRPKIVFEDNDEYSSEGDIPEYQEVDGLNNSQGECVSDSYVDELMA